MLKNIIILVTAFTIGHSITLALSALELITYDIKLIEFAIPLTILITAFNNIINRNKIKVSAINTNYAIALVFGLIHGLGFANYLKAILFKGSIVFELFAFNIGIEVAQIIVVLIFLSLSAVLSKLMFKKRENWVLFVSSIIFGISLMLTFNAKFW